MYQEWVPQSTVNLLFATRQLVCGTASRMIFTKSKILRSSGGWSTHGAPHCANVQCAKVDQFYFAFAYISFFYPSLLFYLLCFALLNFYFAFISSLLCFYKFFIYFSHLFNNLVIFAWLVQAFSLNFLSATTIHSSSSR